MGSPRRLMAPQIPHMAWSVVAAQQWLERACLVTGGDRAGVLDLAQALLEDRLALREHLRLVAEPGHSGREVKQEQEDERERDEEERVRGRHDAELPREHA